MAHLGTLLNAILRSRERSQSEWHSSVLVFAQCARGADTMRTRLFERSQRCPKSLIDTVIQEYTLTLSPVGDFFAGTYFEIFASMQGSSH